MFLYEDFILEAVPRKGVITRTLYEDIPNSVLRVRRRPDLEVEERYKIALCAQKWLVPATTPVAAHGWGGRGKSNDRCIETGARHSNPRAFAGRAYNIRTR